jgi:hypothetical protein
MGNGHLCIDVRVLTSKPWRQVKEKNKTKNKMMIPVIMMMKGIRGRPR